MKRFYSIILISVLIIFSLSSGASPVKVWDVFELTLTASETPENPYGDIPVDGSPDLLKVVFTGTSGRAMGSEYSVTGFWDGENKWKVRFAPPVEGTWKYQSFSADKGLNNASGKIEVGQWEPSALSENPVRRGMIRVNRQGPREGRYFEYADGTPFLWIGDTWWNWAKKDIPFARFKEVADDRAEKGFTLGQLFVPGNGWGEKATIHEDNFTRIDPSHIKKIDSIVSYANQKGISVWIHGWWARENMNQMISQDQLKRWWRYLIHRYAAYNVIWVLAGEYNMYGNGGYPLSFWDELGKMVKEEDPYERIVSTHPTPPGWEGGADAPQWSTAEVLHDATWMDYNQSQPGHGKYRNELTPFIVADSYRKEPYKPIIVTEPWYEFIEGNPSGMDIRFSAWSAFMSGAAGHSYAGGHVWKAHVPESPAGPDTWPMDLDFGTNTLDYPGAVSMGVMSRFLQELEWWRFEPSPDLMLDYPGAYCANIPGEKIIAYLRYGDFAVIDLTVFCRARELKLTWLNPSNGERKITSINGGGRKIYVHSPTSYPGTQEYQDWVMLIERI
ncbi:MAG: DUF4038 domain-containing protein [Bacteroidales bacterium]